MNTLRLFFLISLASSLPSIGADVKLPHAGEPVAPGGHSHARSSHPAQQLDPAHQKDSLLKESINSNPSSLKKEAHHNMDKQDQGTVLKEMHEIINKKVAWVKKLKENIALAYKSDTKGIEKDSHIMKYNSWILDLEHYKKTITFSTTEDQIQEKFTKLQQQYFPEDDD